MRLFAMLIGLAVFALGCSDKQDSAPTEAETTASASIDATASSPEPGSDPKGRTIDGDNDADEILTVEDFEEIADDEITEENLEAELAALEQAFAEDEI